MMTKGKKITSWYYAQNREKLLAYQKKYNKENIEERRKYSRLYFYTKFDHDKARENSIKYREKNREKLKIYNREYQRKRRALMKKSTVIKQSNTSSAKKGSGDWHVSHTSMGMGDYYGTGIKQKVGRMRSGMGMQEITPKKLKTPPKSLG